MTEEEVQATLDLGKPVGQREMRNIQLRVIQRAFKSPVNQTHIVSDSRNRPSIQKNLSQSNVQELPKIEAAKTPVRRKILPVTRNTLELLNSSQREQPARSSPVKQKSV